MKAVLMYAYGDVKQLSYEEVSKPAPKPGEILVQVTSAGVNPIDWKIRSGHMKDVMAIPLPWILGRDVSGVVVETGEGVDHFRVGDKVLGVVNHGYAEFVSDAASSFGPLPDSLDLVEAGALPLVTLTGTQFIEAGLQPKKGDTVLVTGANGGVGRSAVYAAKQLGAHVIAGVLASQKAEAQSIHADQIVALDHDAEIASLPELDAIADTVGGSTQAKLLPRLKKGGSLGSVLGPPAPEGRPDIRFVPFEVKPDGKRTGELAQAVASGHLVIPIGRKMKLSDVREAHELGEKGGAGKIVLIP